MLVEQEEDAGTRMTAYIMAVDISVGIPASLNVISLHWAHELKL
jgi:hypothetical protein